MLKTQPLLLAAVLLLSACSQDPFRMRNFGDAGIAPDAWPDISIGPDGPGADAPGDQGPGDFRPDLSYDACKALPEVCNGVDDNCNGKIDEGFNKLTDPRWCDNCKGCYHLLKVNAYPKCTAGKCAIASCVTGWVDLDPKKPGCEYPCLKTSNQEICDGIDNDCDGKKDNGVTAPASMCKQDGLCKGAKPKCMGSTGWICEYPAGVELQPCKKDADCGTGYKCDTTKGVCPGIVIVNEQLCDGKDGDCDKVNDDPWNNPALASSIGKSCDPTKTCTKDADCGGAGSKCVKNKCTPKLGVCRDQGAYACKSDKSGTECKLTKAGLKPGSETCNNKDDDCDGTIDDNVVDEKWITVNVSGLSSFKIFQYEASRPDATATKSGIASTGRACSVPNRLPWASITKSAALAACKAVGARLCTINEWVAACKGANQSNTFPYGTTFQPNTCNGRAYDTDSSTAGNQDEALATSKPATCVSSFGSNKIYNMSGNVKEWVAKGSGASPSGYEIKGGAYDTPSISTFGAGLSCTYQLPAPTTTLQLPTLGFRCCK